MMRAVTLERVSPIGPMSMIIGEIYRGDGQQHGRNTLGDSLALKILEKRVVRV